MKDNVIIENQEIILRLEDNTIKVLNAAQIDDLEVLSLEDERYVRPRTSPKNIFVLDYNRKLQKTQKKFLRRQLPNEKARKRVLRHLLPLRPFRFKRQNSHLRKRSQQQIPVF